MLRPMNSWSRTAPMTAYHHVSVLSVDVIIDVIQLATLGYDHTHLFHLSFNKITDKTLLHNE